MKKPTSEALWTVLVLCLFAPLVFGILRSHYCPKAEIQELFTLPLIGCPPERKATSESKTLVAKCT